MTGAMEMAYQLDTVEARHPNVGNNGIKTVAGDRLQSFLPVGGFGDDAAELAKPCGEDFTHVRFVVGNQQSDGHHSRAGERSNGSCVDSGERASSHGAGDHGKNPKHRDEGNQNHHGAAEICAGDPRGPGDRDGSAGDLGGDAAILYGKAEAELRGAANRADRKILADSLPADGNLTGAVEPVEQCGGSDRAVAGEMGGSASAKRRAGSGNFSDG